MVHQATEGVEKVLWEQVKSVPIEAMREEVEGWVADPGSMAGRASTYDQLVMLYWVIMNLLMNVSLILEVKRDGDEEFVKAWKDHNANCQLMH